MVMTLITKMLKPSVTFVIDSS